MSVQHQVALAAFVIGLAASFLSRGSMSAASVHEPASQELMTSDTELARLRVTANLAAQRQHVWQSFSELTQLSGTRERPRFESWHGESEVFAARSIAKAVTGIHSFSRSDGGGHHASRPSFGIPVLSYTLYNDAAFRHIRRFGLYRRSTLERLRTTGRIDSDPPQGPSIPAFPREAQVLKTVWWPVAADRMTAMPVWDARENPARPSGNGYLSWERIVAIDPTAASDHQSIGSLSFAGHTYHHVQVVGLEDLYHVRVDAEFSARLMRDPQSRNTALISLGRPLRSGDTLALVGLNLATKEIADWIWAGLWWHDKPNEGAFGSGRPSTIRDEWQHYVLQVAFDPALPVESDGTAHVCFNPWLEGRFPDGGHGGGVASNCLTCHSRASYPPVSYLPITRGQADRAADPAYDVSRLRTGFLWSLALHARP